MKSAASRGRGCSPRQLPPRGSSHNHYESGHHAALPRSGHVVTVSNHLVITFAASSSVVLQLHDDDLDRLTRVVDVGM